MKAFDLYPKKCRQCGKHFEAGSEYAYKINAYHGQFLWFCSWTCIQDYRKKGKKKKIG